MNISIYIHWPFCLSLCPYCDFNSHIATNINIAEWLSAYEKEIEHFRARIEGKNIVSIFFGGGTPSLMSPKLVAGIINKIAIIANVTSKTEITLEANPTSYEVKKFIDFKSSGINRVSIGVQSFNEQGLSSLGRKHSASSAINAIKSASQIFDNYSFDLIYARPDQSLLSWQEELKFALEISGPHISLYQLTIEKGTDFFKLFKNNQLHLPSSDDAALMYESTNDILSTKNYHCYEISNYALDGMECVHNLAYWNYDEYIGIGPGAHSRIHNIKNGSPEIIAVMNYHRPDIWLSKIQKYGNAIQSFSPLTLNEVAEEFVMMSSRLTKGFKFNALENKTGTKAIAAIDFSLLELYQEHNMVHYTQEEFRLTKKGLLLHSAIISNILRK